MERKEIGIQSTQYGFPTITVEVTDGVVNLTTENNRDTLSIAPDQAAALHSALDEMLNPWRDAGRERPEDGKRVLIYKDGLIDTAYFSIHKGWMWDMQHRVPEGHSITLWKELPNMPPIDPFFK